MTTPRLIRSAARIAVACCVITGCFGGEDRAHQHAGQARVHLEAGRLDEALIELHNALKLAPDDANYSEQIARVLIAKDDLASARFYLGEAYRRDSTRESSAIALALLLSGDEPEQAEALISEVLERNPESAWGHIGRAEKALIGFEVDEALAAAQRAVELEPELADAHWHLARVHEARIRERALSGLPTEDGPYEEALDALERFAELDVERRWQERAERARLLAGWPGHEEEAETALREASALLDELELPQHENRVLDRAIELARSLRNPELERWALERKVEIAPRNYAAWEELAELSESEGVPSGGVYRRMIQALPEETEPLIRNARRIQRVRRPLLAVQYLRKQIGQGFDDAAILAEIARIQLASGRRGTALAAVAQLESLHPDARVTQVMLAWALMETGRPEEALRRLEALPWANDDVAAQRVLTDVQTRLGNPEAALAALNRATELVPEPDVRSLRVRARLLQQLGRYRQARYAYRALSRRTPLQPSDMAALARCYIETGGRAVGIRMLERLVDEPSPSQEAVAELFLRTGSAPEQRDRLRRAFAILLEDAPNHPGVLDALTRFEIDAGSPSLARPPVEASRALAERTEQPTGRLSLLIARIEAAEGDTAAARDRVLAILDDQPTLPGVLEFALSLYPTKQESLAAIAELTEGGRKTELPASHHALLGRLYYRAGNQAMSRWSYEQALTGGLELPIFKNDLAFLLAKSGRDLKRAELLARQAAQAMPDEPGVIDTLGFVLLKQEEYDRAANQFRRALGVARERGLPQATIQYHLGLTLEKLERFVEAEQAFALSLELGEDFADEAAARRQLAGLRGEI
jgi:tetratricopeptide (TPR) repeat protein